MSDPELCEQTFRIFGITDVRYSVGTVPCACPCVPMPAPNPEVCASRHGWAPPQADRRKALSLLIPLPNSYAQTMRHYLPADLYTVV
jgi:hypothetical protein